MRGKRAMSQKWYCGTGIQEFSGTGIQELRILSPEFTELVIIVVLYPFQI